MSTHVIHLIGGDDDEVATVSQSPKDGLCHISFSYRGKVIEESAVDYFEAFSRVRSRLEDEGLIPFCYGASLNVFPSGMCRDMGGGLMAYRLALGRKPLRSDLVRIFDEGPDVIPAKVAVQREFYEKWLKKAAEPGATDNPDDAQRLREDH